MAVTRMDTPELLFMQSLPVLQLVWLFVGPRDHLRLGPVKPLVTFCCHTWVGLVTEPQDAFLFKSLANNFFLGVLSFSHKASTETFWSTITIPHT